MTVKRVLTMDEEELAKSMLGLSTGSCMLCPLVEHCDKLDAAGLYDSGWKCEREIAKYLLEEVEE